MEIKKGQKCAVLRHFTTFFALNHALAEAVARHTVHEMARDEARHGKAFEGLLKRYFGK